MKRPSPAQSRVLWAIRDYGHAGAEAIAREYALRAGLDRTVPGLDMRTAQRMIHWALRVGFARHADAGAIVLTLAGEARLRD